MNLWSTFHSIFDTDDGSLPEIAIAHITPAGLADVWMYLRTAAVEYAGDNWFWHHSTERETPLDSVQNAAALVVIGEAEIFHTVLNGISFFGSVIPDLGVFVFQDAIVLDYRMGHDWNAANLTALFELLRQIQNIEPGAQISLSPTFFHPKWRAEFQAAFAEYIQRAE